MYVDNEFVAQMADTVKMFYLNGLSFTLNLCKGESPCLAIVHKITLGTDGHSGFMRKREIRKALLTRLTRNLGVKPNRLGMVLF